MDGLESKGVRTKSADKIQVRDRPAPSPAPAPVSDIMPTSQAFYYARPHEALAARRLPSQPPCPPPQVPPLTAKCSSHSQQRHGTTATNGAVTTPIHRSGATTHRSVAWLLDGFCCPRQLQLVRDGRALIFLHFLLHYSVFLLNYGSQAPRADNLHQTLPNGARTVYRPTVLVLRMRFHRVLMGQMLQKSNQSINNHERQANDQRPTTNNQKPPTQLVHPNG
jgi:hypothetical protein